MLAHVGLRPIDLRLDELYDEAANLINDAGMSWSDYWSMPRDKIDRYIDACNRRAARQRES